MSSVHGCGTFILQWLSLAALPCALQLALCCPRVGGSGSRMTYLVLRTICAVFDGRHFVAGLL